MDVFEGEIYDGEITKISDYGVFVEIRKGVIGLVHRSRLPGGDTSDDWKNHVKVGDQLRVKVLPEDVMYTRGKIRLTAILNDQEEEDD